MGLTAHHAKRVSTPPERTRSYPNGSRRRATMHVAGKPRILAPHMPPAPSRSLLSRVSFYADAVSAAAGALARRAAEGRPHAEWTLSYDVAMSVLRRVAHAHPELSKSLARSSTAPVPLSVASRVQLSHGTLAGMPTETHSPTRWAWDRALGKKRGAVGEATFLFLHGGGYVTCSPRTHRDVIARIALASGARCIAPDYRLAPAYPFPAALDDALACYRALLAQGQDPDRLFVGGDSAGGGLTLALMLRLREEREPLPRALVLLSPWVDLSLPYEALAPYADHDYLEAQTTVTNALLYAGGHALTNPLISPAHADLRGLPPMFVQTGEWELLREQNIEFVRRAQRAGVAVEHALYPGMLHAFTCFAGLTRQGERAIAAAGKFLRSQLAARLVVEPAAKAS